MLVSLVSLTFASIVGLSYFKKSKQVKEILEECLIKLAPSPAPSKKIVDVARGSELQDRIVAETKTQMNQLAHIVSHDLRSPLRTINSFTGLLKKSLGDRLTEREMKHMEFIQSDTQKLNTILQEIAEFARIEQELIQPWERSLSHILQQAIDQCKNEIENSKIQISYPKELPNLFCDERKIKEIFIQIIRNAIRYAAPGSTPRLDIHFTQNDSSVCFDFTDNGIGIPEKSVASIFNPFTQLKAVNNPKGIGIGLAICKKYVELHEGKISCTSKVGKTTFSLSLKKELHQYVDFNVSLATTSM